MKMPLLKVCWITFWNLMRLSELNFSECGRSWGEARCSDARWCWHLKRNLLTPLHHTGGQWNKTEGVNLQIDAYTNKLQVWSSIGLGWRRIARFISPPLCCIFLFLKSFPSNRQHSSYILSFKIKLRFSLVSCFCQATFVPILAIMFGKTPLLLLSATALFFNSASAALDPIVIKVSIPLQYTLKAELTSQRAPSSFSKVMALNSSSKA